MSQDVNGAAVLDEQPSDPPSSPLPNRGPLRSLFFSGSQEEAEAELSPPASPPPADGDAFGSSRSEWPTSPDESPDETSSPASSAEGTAKPLSEKALRLTARRGVLIASSMAHRVAARTELEKRAGLYIADDQDQELIGDPIASLLSRRGSITGGTVSPDLNDGIQLAMAVANYVGKQVSLATEIRQLEQPAPGEVA